jgi:hypothetical protein
LNLIGIPIILEVVDAIKNNNVIVSTSNAIVPSF